MHRLKPGQRLQWRVRRAQRWMLGGLVAGLAGFAVVAVDNLVDGPLAQADLHVNRQVGALQEAGYPMHSLGAALTLIGDGTTVALAVLAAAAYMLTRKEWKLALWALLIGAANSWAIEGLKQLFQRARPPGLGLELGYAFPSGHTFGATAGLGAAIILATEVHRRRRGPRPHRLDWRALWATALVTWATLAGLAGLGRVLAQEHWLSDVMASWALGLALVSGILLVLSRTHVGGEAGPRARPTPTPRPESIGGPEEETP